MLKCTLTHPLPISKLLSNDIGHLSPLLLKSLCHFFHILNLLFLLFQQAAMPATITLHLGQSLLPRHCWINNSYICFKKGIEHSKENNVRKLSKHQAQTKASLKNAAINVYHKDCRLERCGNLGGRYILKLVSKVWRFD